MSLWENFRTYQNHHSIGLFMESRAKIICALRGLPFPCDVMIERNGSIHLMVRNMLTNMPDKLMSRFLSRHEI